MDKRCIGIEIDQAYLRAVQIVGVPEGFHVEKVFSTATRRESDSLPDTLRSLFSTHGFDRRAEVAVSMPHDLVFFRNIQTDASGLGQLRNGVIDALENSFPIPIAEVVAQVCSSHKCDDDKYSVLTAAVSRTSLREMQNLLDSTSVRCRLVETPVCAILLALAVHHPQIKSGSAIVVHVDDACLTLAVIAENDVMMVRNIPIALPSDGDADSIQKTLAATIASEAQITWHKSFGAAMDAEAEVFLLADPGDCGLLESFVASNLKCSVTIPDLSAGTLTSTAGKAGLPYCVAEGLALRILEPEKTKGINFLDAGKDEAAPPINIKKELVTYSALVAVFIVLLLVGIFTQLSCLEAAYTDVKADIHDTFTAALPEEKNIVSPLAQMEQKLDSFRKDYELHDSFGPNAMGPLRILRAISMVIPSQAGLIVDDMLIAKGSVRISGTCGSFESVYEWQRLLQAAEGGAFEQVDVKDVQKVPNSGLVRFTMTISYLR